MKLSDILKNIDYIELDNMSDYSINHVFIDSREKLESSIFIGIKGFSVDGAKFADAAITNGAVAVVYETDIDKKKDNVVYIKVADTRKAAGVIASQVYQSSYDLKVIGITGTNGKTSTAYIIRHILSNIGGCGMLGTVEYDLGDRKIVPTHTTPESVYVFRYLKEIDSSDCKYAVMEVSSHALSLNRVENLEFDVTALTNISQDHLDFHKTMDNYIAAKSKLFTDHVKEEGISIINIDDDNSDKFTSKIDSGLITISRKNSNADYYAPNYNVSDRGIELNFIHRDKNYTFKTNVFGDFQVYNLLCAVAICNQLGVKMEDIEKALEADFVIPGRLEKVNRKGYNVFVDYAHTPDALEKAIESLKSSCKGEFITLFGCGGDRDSEKRPLMGEIAEKLSDKIIVTSDNPRTEPAGKIIEDILAGIKNREKAIIVENRREAIEVGVDMLSKDDYLLIAGKGHEEYQEICGVKLHFSDKETALKVINDKD